MRTPLLTIFAAFAALTLTGHAPIARAQGDTAPAAMPAPAIENDDTTTTEAEAAIDSAPMGDETSLPETLPAADAGADTPDGLSGGPVEDPADGPADGMAAATDARNDGTLPAPDTGTDNPADPAQGDGADNMLAVPDYIIPVQSLPAATADGQPVHKDKRRWARPDKLVAQPVPAPADAAQ